MTVQFNFTTVPSMMVGCDLENGQFFRMQTRTRALVGKFGMDLCAAALNDVVSLDKQAQSIPSDFGPNHYVKLRYVFIDDKSGNFTLHVDYLHDEGVKPEFTEEDIKTALGDGTVQHFGQGQWVEVSIKTGLFSSDYFSPVADDYYE